MEDKTLNQESNEENDQEKEYDLENLKELMDKDADSISYLFIILINKINIKINF